MAPNETAKLDELVEMVNGLRSDFRVFVTSVMGTSEGENPEGRIPRLEATAKNHEKRLQRVERVLFMVFGAILLMKGLAMTADSLAHIMEVFRH